MVMKLFKYAIEKLTEARSHLKIIIGISVIKKRIIVSLIIINFLLMGTVPIANALENKQDELKLTFKEAVFLALRNNAKIKSAEVGRISQKYAVVVAKHSFQPNYSLQSSYQYYSTTEHKNKYSKDAFDIQPKVSLLTPYGTEFGLSMNNPIDKERDGHKGWEYTPSLTFEITQPLIRGFGRDVVEASLKNTLDNEEINKLQYKDVIADTINTVIADYINLARAIETLKISQVSLASYQTIIKKAKALIEAGRMAKNDIIQVEAQIAFQNSVIENNKNELMRAQGKLLNTLGLDNQTSIQIPEKIDYVEIEQIFVEKNLLPTVDNCKKLVLTNNTSYQIAGTMLKILGRSLLVAKDGTNWKLDLIASANRHGREDRENSNINNLMRNREHNEKVALNLNIPIDDVNAKKAVIDAQVSLDQSKLSYQQLKRQLELDVMTTHSSVINAKRQLDLSKQALKLQYQTVEIAELKYNAGRISNFELLNNQKDLSTLNQSVINNQVNYISTLTTFSKILGETLTHFAIKLAY
jgi:outer membrane protein TolC